MAFSRTDLFDHLTTMAIATTTVEHPPAFTVADSTSADLDLPGAHTKNLFLKDDEGTLFLVIAKSSTKVDLKALAKRLNAGRMSFGKPELLMAKLGVTPGAVTAFSVINDTEGLVRVIFDQQLMVHDSINCHPLENTATTNIARDDLLRFIRASGHEPKISTLTSAA